MLETSSDHFFALDVTSFCQPAASNCFFEDSFILKTIEIPPEGGSCPMDPVVEIPDDGLSSAEVTVDADVIPPGCAPYVPNRNAMLFCPEEWNSVEGLAMTEHIRGHHLALALSNCPMLNPDRLVR